MNLTALEHGPQPGFRGGGGGKGPGGGGGGNGPGGGGGGMKGGGFGLPGARPVTRSQTSGKGRSRLSQSLF